MTCNYTMTVLYIGLFADRSHKTELKFLSRIGLSGEDFLSRNGLKQIFTFV